MKNNIDKQNNEGYSLIAVDNDDLNSILKKV